MTDTPTTDLTAPEAVERMARVIERHQTRKRQNHARNPRYQPPDERYEPIPDTIRALSAALEAERARAKALTAALEKAEKALQPFARHVDKRTCKITMLWQDGDYKSTYTDTLTPQDFFAAHEAICAAREAVK